MSREYHVNILEHRRKKTCLLKFANNKDADQPVHTRSLISAIVIRLLERIIFSLATSEISNFYLISIAEETGVSLVLSKTLKTGFVASMRTIYGTKSRQFHVNMLYIQNSLWHKEEDEREQRQSKTHNTSKNVISKESKKCSKGQE